MAELVDLFVGELSRRVNELQECCAQNDWNSIRRLAHQLKGASAGYGFAPVGIAAGELELRANKALQTHAQADSERAADQLRQLIAICQRVRAA